VNRDLDGGGRTIDTVRKLLAMAESTANEHEADAFAAKAAALIAAHRIDPARLADSGVDDVLAVREVPIGRGAYVRARLALLGAVADAHDCELVWRSGPAGATAVLAGFTSDLEATVVLYHSLHAQAAGRMAGGRRSTAAATQRWRRAFLFGYAARIGELLAETRRRVEHDARAAAGGGALPDLPDRAARVRVYASGAFGRVVVAAPPAPAARTGWQHGQHAASAADIGRSRLAGRGQLGPGQ
jgi:hypothetical protein